MQAVDGKQEIYLEWPYPESSVVASRCLISSDHVGNLAAIFTFSSLEHKVMKATKRS